MPEPEDDATQSAPAASDASAPSGPEASNASTATTEPTDTEVASDAGTTLQAAQHAFEVGDFRRVRALTATLVDARDADVARAALELRRRTQVDPVQVGVLLFCLGLFGWVAWTYVFSR